MQFKFLRSVKWIFLSFGDCFYPFLPFYLAIFKKLITIKNDDYSILKESMAYANFTVEFTAPFGICHIFKKPFITGQFNWDDLSDVDIFTQISQSPGFKLLPEKNLVFVNFKYDDGTKLFNSSEVQQEINDMTIRKNDKLCATFVAIPFDTPTRSGLKLLLQEVTNLSL